VAVQLPEHGELNQDQRQQVLAAVKGHLLRFGLTQEDVANAIGKFSEPTLCQILKGNYKSGRLDEYVRDLNNWIEQDARRRAGALAKKPLVTTAVVQQVINAAQMCREAGKMGVVMGPTGIGKSATAEELASSIPGTIYLVINEDSYTKQGLLRALCGKMRLSVRRAKGQPSGSRFAKVCAALGGTHRLVILDDADKLNDKSLELLREIHDATRVPMLLIGVVDIWQRIERSADQDHGQLKRRFTVRIDLLQACQRKSGRGRRNEPLFSREQIRQICSPPKVRLVGRATEYLWIEANRHGDGGIGRCLDLVFHATRALRKKHQLGAQGAVSISEADLRSIARRIGKTVWDIQAIEESDAELAKEAKSA